MGDLIALFRCISCRYNFSTTTAAPDLLGAPGRVFATGEVRELRRCLSSEPRLGSLAILPSLAHFFVQLLHYKHRSVTISPTLH